MKRKLVTIMMTMALATTLVACKNTDTNAESNSEPISNSEFVMQNAELETKEPTELETKESAKEVESKETTEATKEAETEESKETEEATEATEETESTESKEAESKEETSNKEETTKKEENTASSKKEDTSKTENTSKKNEVKNDTSKKNEASSNTEVNNNTSNNNNSNNANTEANNNTSSNSELSIPNSALDNACTHPQTYINSGMFLRRESLGGGCYKDIEAAEDICITCGAVVRSYERVGQEVHGGYHISGDAKAPTCTEDGYDYTTTTCDCGGYVNTNNRTEPATGHYYTTWCTGEVSEDGMKAKYVTACSCGDVQAEWWE